MRLKAETFRKAAQPVRKVQQLERTVQNYKPVSNHKHNVSHSIYVHFFNKGFSWKLMANYGNYLLQIEYEQKKKAEGKKARDDKEAVLEMIYAAFEKHQYYNIKDLVKITRQPVVSRTYGISISQCST